MSEAVGSQTHGAGHHQKSTLPSLCVASTRGHHERHAKIFQGVGPHRPIKGDRRDAAQNEVRLVRTQTRCANNQSARFVGMTSQGDIDVGHHLVSMLSSAFTLNSTKLTGNVMQFVDRFMWHIPLKIESFMTKPFRSRSVWLCQHPC